jgi:protein TIF31
MREARIHLRHVRDLLKSLDPSDAYNGLDCSSLSFLNVVTQGDILGKCFYFHLLIVGIILINY